MISKDMSFFTVDAMAVLEKFQPVSASVTGNVTTFLQ